MLSLVSCLVVAALLVSDTTVSAFVVGPSISNINKANRRSSVFSSPVVNGSSSSITASQSSATDFVKDLLESLAGEGDGKKLLDNSSSGWRTAIYEAVGAPPTADEKIVAKALTDAMSRPNNQFAILMGKAEKFVTTFPSDPVAYDDETSWVEVRLRDAEDDELLVTMGISLEKRKEDGAWAIAKLDWQDFRDKFYPGLSGREWLRSF